jgi:hypothetical protein
MSRAKAFRLSKIWNPTTIFLRYSNTYRLDRINGKHREECVRKKIK